MGDSRLDRVRAVCEAEGTALLLNRQPEIRWSCGFSGSSGMLLVAPDRAVLLTDGRYEVQASNEVTEAEVIVYDSAAGAFEALANVANGFGSIAIDPANVSVGQHDALAEALSGVELRRIHAPLRAAMAIKEPAELAALRKAQSITDEVFEELLSTVTAGMTEVEVLAQVVFGHLNRGAVSMSFDPIVATGPNGSLPHARPTGRRLAQGDLLVLDFGCIVDGYASDMTRTVSIGAPSRAATEAYDVVLSALTEAQSGIRPGMVGSEVDKLARSVIERAGFGDRFPHSTGHGIGLSVHEWPRLGLNSGDRFEPGMVVTIEPGVYMPGEFGIRIENMVLVTELGVEPLPTSSTSLQVI